MNTLLRRLRALTEALTETRPRPAAAPEPGREHLGYLAVRFRDDGSLTSAGAVTRHKATAWEHADFYEGKAFVAELRRVPR